MSYAYCRGCTTDSIPRLSSFRLEGDSSDFFGKPRDFSYTNWIQGLDPGMVIQSIAFQIDLKRIKSSRNTLIAELDSYREFEDNWDGYGATRVDPVAIEQAKDLIQLLQIPPKVSPTTYGPVQLEYVNAKGDYLEFEVFRDHIDMFFASADRVTMKECTVTVEGTLNEVNSFHDS